jgi:hypothetical protein
MTMTSSPKRQDQRTRTARDQRHALRRGSLGGRNPLSLVLEDQRTGTKDGAEKGTEGIKPKMR